MPNNIRFSNPDTIAKPPGYSHVVEMTGPGRPVYFAGQLGMDRSGKMGATVREQIELAFENLKAALASVGAVYRGPDRVVIGQREQDLAPVEVDFAENPLLLSGLAFAGANRANAGTSSKRPAPSARPSSAR